LYRRRDSNSHTLRH